MAIPNVPLQLCLLDMASDALEIQYCGPEANFIRSRSLSRWQAALHLAESTQGIPTGSLNLEGILYRTPCLPENISCDAVSIEGYSTWTNSDASCRLTKIEKVLRIALRKRHPTTCKIASSRNFLDWEGKPNNGIALLILGWAYILSANLAERQDLCMEYGPVLSSPPGPEVHLDYALPQELAWWKAIVTPGVGWSIVGGQVSPWAVRVEEIGIGIAGNFDVVRRPPTAREAACYLARLCHAFDLGDQCSAALAAALTLPLHASTAPLKAATIELPRPSLPVRVASPSQHTCPTEFNHLGYYMSFSLCPWIFGPSLWSVFWEPDIPCNFAGAWLGPITTVLDPIIRDNNLELLAKVLSFTKVAPLWLGVALCGRRAIVESIIPSLAELRDYPYARPDVNSAAWTGVAQSFMDLHPPGPYLRHGVVSRADVWRLRHDCNREYEDGAFSYTPPYGWPPFGEMRAEDVELEIRGHLQCSHRWIYACWTWLPDGISDVGFSTDCPASLPSEHILTDGNGLQQGQVLESKSMQDISKRATEAVFWWCCSQVEKGFGGVLVKHRPGHDKARESAEGANSPDRETIYKWLRSLEAQAKA